MKKQWKGFAFGVIVTLLCVGLVGSAFAAYQKRATLDYTGINITLNGSAVTPKDANGNALEPFAIDGTTYLPVRGVASAMGLDVAWDQATQTVALTTGSSVTENNNFPVDQISPFPEGSTFSGWLPYSGSPEATADAIAEGYVIKFAGQYWCSPEYSAMIGNENVEYFEDVSTDPEYPETTGDYLQDLIRQEQVEASLGR